MKWTEIINDAAKLHALCVAVGIVLAWVKVVDPPPELPVH